MASKKKDTSESSTSGYQPKATARHAKIVRSKEEETESLKKKIDTDKYLAKKYESNRKTEIKALPKEERAAAKADLKESIAHRKEAERRDKEKLRGLQSEERSERRNLGKEPFDEDAWIKGGKKKDKDKAQQPPQKEPEAEEYPETEEDLPEETADEPEPAGEEEKEN
ncbi:MAG: hypothetical protein FWG41_06185 [Methanomassiliicoccaceae archaeon]|nr:hypothetical protein [Methanomassiliicoccaceae archaeon]